MINTEQLSFDFITERELLYEEKRGRVKNIIYENPETNWKVVELISQDDNKTYKLAGFLPNVNLNDNIFARCTKTEHPKFGESFQIDEFYKELPFTKHAVMKFLVSEIDGIGALLSERIVDRFKDKTLEVLEEKTDKLLEVEGITKKLLDKIKSCALKVNTNIKELILMGFSDKWASRIFLKYGDLAITLVKSNPYRLIQDFKGIGFKKADIIAKNIGIDELSEDRIKAAIYFILDTIIKKTGHNFLYLDELKKAVSKLVNLPYAYIEAYILSDKGLIIEEDRVYLPIYYEAEKIIAFKLKEKLGLGVKQVEDFKNRINKIESDICIKFNKEQKEAIYEAFINSVTIITGAAGTGKSTICKGLLKLIENYGLTYRVCAPTGKAAYKLKTITGIEAYTIHRLFRYVPSKGFFINETNPLIVDYLIIDEASMVDLLLLKAVMLGISNKTRIIFIGDPYQIPPVEPGCTLQSMMSSYAVSQVILSDIFRQQKNSAILKNANLINLERVFPLENTDDFKFIDAEDPREMIAHLFNSINELHSRGYDPIRDINVLTPLNKGGGDISVYNLNIRLRDKLNPRTADNFFFVFDKEFRTGDKVMQRKNDYELDIFNGDIGYIVNNDSTRKNVGIEFFSRVKNIPYKLMENITLNYAMTVHKAQGSENRAIIFLATRSGCFFLLNKNLFYTAMTRAKEKLIMIMPYEVVKMAVKFNIYRKSYLSSRIQKIVIGREKD
ncbi:MAG: AAA family ATPase [Candidatus Hydrogenedentota bacterium]